MTTISEGRDVVTLINVFTVEPEHQQELVDFLADATNSIIRQVPGFISANLHRSLDGTRVANYAQWESRDALQAMLRRPDVIPHLEAATRLATADPVVYEVVHCYEAPGSGASA